MSWLPSRFDFSLLVFVVFLLFPLFRFPHNKVAGKQTRQVLGLTFLRMLFHTSTSSGGLNLCFLTSEHLIPIRTNYYV
jgi:hypothetical protein